MKKKTNVVDNASSSHTPPRRPVVNQTTGFLDPISMSLPTPSTAPVKKQLEIIDLASSPLPSSKTILSNKKTAVPSTSFASLSDSEDDHPAVKKVKTAKTTKKPDVAKAAKVVKTASPSLAPPPPPGPPKPPKSRSQSQQPSEHVDIDPALATATISEVCISSSTSYWCIADTIHRRPRASRRWFSSNALMTASELCQTQRYVYPMVKHSDRC